MIKLLGRHLDNPYNTCADDSDVVLFTIVTAAILEVFFVAAV